MALLDQRMSVIIIPLLIIAALLPLKTSLGVCLIDCATNFNYSYSLLSIHSSNHQHPMLIVQKIGETLFKHMCALN